MSKSVGIVVLAAGKGTRLKVSESKPMVPILNKRLVDFPLAAALEFLQKVNGSISLVTGHQREELELYLNNEYIERGTSLSFVHQKEQLGTAHALTTYFNENQQAKNFDYTLVMCADTPLLQSDDLFKLYNQIVSEDLEAVAATFRTAAPYGYGRIVRGSKGFHIIEEKDACEEVKKINEVNSGLYFVKTEFALKHLSKIGTSNKAGEFYLTDLFQDQFNVKAVEYTVATAFIGVNTLEQLENVERLLRNRKITELGERGVRFVDRTQVYLDSDVIIGEGSLIHPNVYLQRGTIVGKGVTIEPGCWIAGSKIKDNATIKANSYLDDAIVGESASVGPFAHLRPGSDIGSEAKIGNFVEVKKSKLAKGVKVSHLSYVGDAEIGDDTNIGCGFITCNYDGAQKHLTKIGKGCFIGSDSQMIAPVEIGDECYVASGSTINISMPSGSFGIARMRQVTKEGMARKFIKKKK